MIFTTPEFVLFLAAFLPIYAASRGRGRKWALLAASYLFYAAWDVRFLALLCGSTALDFAIARALGRVDDEATRRRLVIASALGNLGVLGLFKYHDFFAASAAAALGELGVTVHPWTLDLVLPVGVSFYTFQTLGYTIDVYRRRIAPCGSLLDFACYVAFFPQLVAGPIERASALLPQLAALGPRRRGDSSGWGLIAVGAFKKVVIADNLASIVELTYADPSSTHAAALWVGTYAFAVQIYCDFSGYSDIAVGLGRLMGVRLSENFRAPYASTGPREFWRRWHITLSSWLRDYLYIPLGGNRGGPWRTGRNLLITMLLGGLWHGAAWHFVLWGAFHGALLLLARLLPAASYRWIPWPLRALVFFHVTCLGWALFRAETLADCGVVLTKLLDPRGWQFTWWIEQVQRSGEGGPLTLALATIAFVVLLQLVTRQDSPRLVALVWREPWVTRLYFVALLLAACVVLAPEAPPPFIYFQF